MKNHVNINEQNFPETRNITTFDVVFLHEKGFTVYIFSDIYF